MKQSAQTQVLLDAIRDLAKTAGILSANIAAINGAEALAITECLKSHIQITNCTCEAFANLSRAAIKEIAKTQPDWYLNWVNRQTP
jgi:hypothetical protein